eukprot:TRINITY_DN11909_c1_g1_i1.p1 TRINITY_DN11909_c1_g1~~TRINITY_DN11909_c1_g1_i1.p1  ORF type:complete len:1242 (+),score=227.20 TRINITY_DN11909_c1_g1_i1:114-3839(+)
MSIRSVTGSSDTGDGYESCFNCSNPARLYALCSNSQCTIRRNRLPVCGTCSFTPGCPDCHSHMEKRCPMSDIPSDLQTISEVEAPADVLTALAPEAVPTFAVAHWPGEPQPRPYQQKAYQQTCQQNTIVNLATGLGKTLVAVMVADHFLRSWPNKHVIFCVMTVDLAKQQAAYIQERSTVKDIRVLDVTSSNLKQNKFAWDRALANYNVLVAVGDVFKQALVDRAFLRLQQLSLIVFDECHHAIGNNAFVAMMQDPQDWNDLPSHELPRILGLTGSYLHGRCKDFIARRDRLQSSLRSKMWSADEDEVAPYLTEQTFATVLPDVNSTDHMALQQRCSKELKQLLQQLAEGPLEGQNIDLEKPQEKALRVFNQLGFFGWLSYVEKSLTKSLQGKMQDSSSDEIMPKAIESWKKLEPCPQKAASGKLKILLNLLAECAPNQSAYRCMIFVEQIEDAHPLAFVINRHFENTVAFHISGQSSMSQTTRDKHLGAFKEGRVPILVATQAMEEGIDVPSCNMVVCYDEFHNVKSHIQRSGRARMKHGKIFYFENNWEDEAQQARLMHAAARSDSSMLDEKPRAAIYPYAFEHPTTKATLDAYNCLAILREYVQKTAKGEWPNPFKFGVDRQLMECVVPIPPSPGQLVLQEVEVANFWKRAAENQGEPKLTDFTQLLDQERIQNWTDVQLIQHRCAYVAVRRLIDQGFIDEHNMPSEEALCCRFVCNGGSSSSQDAFGTLELSEPRAARLTTQGQAVCRIKPASELDMKSQLYSLLQAYLRRPVSKHDVKFSRKSTNCGNWLSTLRLEDLDGRAGEGEEFTGEMCTRTADSDQSASEAALKRLRVLHASQGATPTTACSGPSTSDSSLPDSGNPKGELQNLVMSRLRKAPETLSDDFHYKELDCEGFYFFVELCLGPALKDWSGVFRSKPRAPKTKKQIAEAQKEVAVMALEAIRNTQRSLSQKGGHLAVVATVPENELPAGFAVASQDHLRASILETVSEQLSMESKSADQSVAERSAAWAADPASSPGYVGYNHIAERTQHDCEHHSAEIASASGGQLHELEVQSNTEEIQPGPAAGTPVSIAPRLQGDIELAENETATPRESNESESAAGADTKCPALSERNLAAAATGEQLLQDVVQPKSEADGSEPNGLSTISVCLVRPDGREKKVRVYLNMTVSQLLEQYKPRDLAQHEVEAVYNNEVLGTELTLSTIYPQQELKLGAPERNVCEEAQAKELKLHIRRAEDW